MPRNGPSELNLTVATQRRAQIMRAVMASITEEGLECTTMRNVADRAGVSTGTIAYYFKSKKEMVDAALLEASQDYMNRFYQLDATIGHWSLDKLVEGFLAQDNPDAGFVLQMIEVGLHNSELRGTHQWMVETGRSRIEDSLRLGIDAGRFRSDIDPKLAAAMFHGVLIWWGSELMSNATSVDMARDVGRLALNLLENRPKAARKTDANEIVSAEAGASTIESIRSLLMADPLVPSKAAAALADAVERLYEGVRSDGGP